MSDFGSGGDGGFGGGGGGGAWSGSEANATIVNNADAGSRDGGGPGCLGLFAIGIPAGANANAAQPSLAAKVVDAIKAIVISAIAIALAIWLIRWQLGDRRFEAFVFWSAVIVTPLALIVGGVLAYRAITERAERKVLKWINIGARIGNEVIVSSMDAQAELHKALGRVTVEHIKTLRSAGIFDAPEPSYFLERPQQAKQLPPPSADDDYYTYGLDDNDRYADLDADYTEEKHE